MRAGKRVAFFASSLVSAYWNGAATYYRGIVRAMAGRGHRVTFFEPDAYDRQQHRDIPDPDWAEVVVYPAQSEDDVLEMVERARDADVVIKASGVGVYDELLEAAVIEHRRPGSIVIFWDVDAPATLDRMVANPDDPFTALVPEYDLICTYGGGPAVVSAYLARGATTCVPIYNALDPSTHHRVAPDPRFAADLAFLGNRLPDREARVEEFFLSPAMRLPKRRFLLGGNGWQDRSLPENVAALGHVYTRDHNAFNTTPLAVLNINRSSMASYGFSPPTRIFEAAGAGACILSDAWVGIDEFLEPGVEILVARSGDEVIGHVHGLDPETARRIGANARERILAQHTYTHRVATLEAVLEGSTTDRAAQVSR
jgi:spore maturation protein CgeB